jgi:dipeptidyl-peptidase 4
VRETASKDTFPRQYARTQRLTLGEPRHISVSPDGRRVVFARSRAGDDPVNCLWLLDLESGEERLVADPRQLLDDGDGERLPPEERARRERARETAGGVTTYATDDAATVAAFALGGRLFVAGLLSAQARELPVEGPVFDPRPDPAARRLAYVRGATLRVAELDGSQRELVGPEDGEADVTWGSADFIAAEEIGRSRGFWWSPDGSALAVTRVDSSPVGTWWIGDPAHPDQPPGSIRFPAAGTPNATTQLHVVQLDGFRTRVVWDDAQYPYLVNVTWADSDRLLVAVQSRDQGRLAVLEVDRSTCAATTRFEDEDEAWVEIVPGTPAVLDDGRLVVAADRNSARRLLVDGVAVTPPELQVRTVVGTGLGQVVFLANDLGEPTEQHVWRWTDGAARERLTEPGGVHTASTGGATVVVRRVSLDEDRAVTSVLGGPELVSLAERPLVTPQVVVHRLGERRLATAVLLPNDSSPWAGDDSLPVLLDPYGGPHAQRVLSARSSYLTSQWFADQGFAVVVVDGRGTPGRGADWERAVHRDLAGPVLEDQIDGLLEAARLEPRLDLARVAIRGWSFGGYLAALAVLRRPDVFHAAVAGAPVTEWRLYDTHYTERYLGDPGADPGPYDLCSLLPSAGTLTRPLLLIHGLADDNVVAAHSLQLSSALLAGGRAHEVLPLSGVTHMTPQEVVAENLLLLQLDFLRRSLPGAGAVRRRANDPRD